MAPPQETTVNPATPSRVVNGISNSFSLSDGKLSINGITLLSEVPSNVTFSSFSSIHKSSNAPFSIYRRVKSRAHKGGFLGFSQPRSSDRLKNSLGRFISRDFLSIFRFKAWWSTMWIGNSGSDLQKETQWILFQVPELNSYVFLLPLLEGKFRSAIEPGVDGHVMICAESGSSQVEADTFRAIAYVHFGDNPFTLMKEAYSSARVHLNTFRLLEEKSLPPLVDKFGWCTWDAFYLTVDPLGVWHGMKDLAEGGVPPRFLIIDDGWQSINLDGDDPHEDAKNLVLGGEQMTARLYRFEECEKFRRYRGGSFLGPHARCFDPKKQKEILLKALEIERTGKARSKAIQSRSTDLSSFDSKMEELRRELDQMLAEREDVSISVDGNHCNGSSYESQDMGMKAFIKDLRTKFRGLDDVYVWQALCGAWGGVRPGLAHLDSEVISVKLSPGLSGTMDDLAVDKIVEGGIGLVHPDQAGDFYDSMHSYLAKIGITGIKVDVIHTLEYACEEYGGRVELAKAYYEGLTKSLLKNFNGTGIISSMQHCNDFFFLGTWQTAIGRAGDDFWSDDPNGDPMGIYWLQGAHMINCAYNSLWMGQMIQPDWDMFQSDHVCAKFHAASRAICGGPVYVSDSVGCHDFELLKKLVFPDGSIPKCKHFALPTRDCLFKNPLFDEKTVLKIWNLNKFGGVIGAFNCQGAGWDPKERRVRGYPQSYKPVSGSVHVMDVEWDQKEEAGKMGNAEEYIVHLNQVEKLLLMNPNSEAIQFTLQPSSFEIFSFVPIKKLRSDLKFAPIGLMNMFNCGGTITEVEYGESWKKIFVRIKVKGVGKLLVYSSEEPKSSLLDGVEVGVQWSSDGKLTVDLPWKEERGGASDLIFAY
ncbi:stachyose synthase [Cocos nucifera]|uniref:Stachyose synthase n=1 Tax=Cocos nucifera TaxID=13894 RepID=A0A8K0NAA0_COCNU|nr:stachyose synthase [Cocos nucifera]